MRVAACVVIFFDGFLVIFFVLVDMFSSWLILVRIVSKFAWN